MPKYRIGNRSANHRRKENGGWKSYRFGDQIDLSVKAFESGQYRNLQLTPLYGTAVEDEEEKLVDPVNGNNDPNAGGQQQTDEDSDNGGDDTTDDTEVSREKIEELLVDVKESKVDDGSFEKVREKIVALDLFDNLPETKKGVIEALESLLD